MKKTTISNCMSALFVSLLSLFACSANTPGTMPDPEPDVKVIKLNSIDKKVTGLENGFYDFRFVVKGNPAQEAIWVKAGNHCSTSLLSGSAWAEGVVRGIEVTDGTLGISYGCLDGTSADVTFSSLYLTKVEASQTFLKGGDMSLLTLEEKNGTKYYDTDGKEGDCFAIMKANGCNIVRLRLYNDPGNPDYYPSGDLPSGVQDEADILALARRAKDAEMEIELTFHYSDYWSNGDEQYKPHAWKDYSFEQLKEVMYTYTKDFLEKMNAQGTTPAYISLGNEMQSGILFGAIDENTGLPSDVVNGYCSNMGNLAALLNSASKACRDVCPDSKIVLHLTTGSSTAKDAYVWFLTEMQDYNVDYDVIGASYYPFWGNFTIETVLSWAEYLTDRYQKDWIFMETGFAWNAKLRDGSDGQISNNLPYTDMTKEAQRRFLLQLTQGMKNASNGHLLGYIYWDPIYIDAPNCGWKKGGKNVTGNSTLFDFDGKALPAFDAMKYNY